MAGIFIGTGVADVANEGPAVCGVVIGKVVAGTVSGTRFADAANEGSAVCGFVMGEI